jgi:hypothetical protein
MTPQFALVPPRLGFVERGGDLPVEVAADAGLGSVVTQVEQVPGPAGPLLGLPDGHDGYGRPFTVVFVHNKVLS